MSKEKNIKNNENSDNMLLEKQKKPQAIAQNKETSHKNQTNQKPVVIKKQPKSLTLVDNKNINQKVLQSINNNTVNKQNKNQSLNNNHTQNNKNEKLNTDKIEKINKSNNESQKNEKAEQKEQEIDQNQNFTKIEKEKNSSNIFIIFGILLGSLVLIILISFLIFSFVMSNSTNIHSGIYIKSIDVSEMSKENAKNKLENYINSKLPEEIILTHNDYEVGLNTEELAIKFDINSAINTAYSLGRNKKLISDGIEIISTMINNKNVEPTFTLKEGMLILFPFTNMCP